MDVTDVLRGTRVVPVAVIDDADSAGALGEALVAGGIDIIEVTLRTERPLVIESFHAVPELGRFVLVRGHDIVAGGIVPE